MHMMQFCLYFTDSLLKYFSRYGEVIDCVVMKNQTTGKSRGFGFVKFREPNCVEDVLANGPHVLDGRQVSWVVNAVITWLQVYGLK